MTTSIIKNSFWGMVIYKKVGQGCLQGLWKNNGQVNGTIVNEIARKNDGNIQQLEGTYVVSWIEETNRIIQGKLKISELEDNHALAFEWRNEEGQIVFKGVGMPIGLNEITATYWGNTPSITLRCE